MDHHEMITNEMHQNRKDTIHLFPDLAALSVAAAERWVTLAQQSIKASGHFHVALTGGTTPQRLYEDLAQPARASRVNWRAVHIWFGDERHVALDHPDSNFRMAHEALLKHVPIPATQIHRMQGELPDARRAASAYAESMATHIPKSTQGMLQFDLVMLGVGADGHIASLFPGTPVLKERAQLAEAVYVEQLQTWRISVTLPVINQARHIMMLVSGSNKAAMVGRVFGTTPNTPLLPVQMIAPTGDMEWYLDQAAARHMSDKERQ